jgi:hypothetical protein
MLYLYGAFLPPEDAFHMHQAAHIGAGDVFGGVFEVIGHPVLSHLDRDRFFGHAKGAAETAAFVLAVEVDDLDIPDHVEELHGFREGRRHEFAHLGQVEPPLAMTTLVESDPMGEASVEAVNPEDVGKKFDEFEYLIVKADVFFYMKYAATRGGDDIIKFGKILYKEGIAVAGEMLEAGIGHGLAAAGLIGGIDYCTAELFQ